jgi:hypothetical protein
MFDIIWNVQSDFPSLKKAQFQGRAIALSQVTSTKFNQYIYLRSSPIFDTAKLHLAKPER